MDIREKIREKLKEQYGDFSTHLEHEYENVVTENLASGKMVDKKAWITYNQVILELKNSLKDKLITKKLQYLLTDNLNPNTACIEVISEIQFKTKELERLYNKISNFNN